MYYTTKKEAEHCFGEGNQWYLFCRSEHDCKEKFLQKFFLKHPIDEN
jgi:hypothetical protein